MLLDGYSPTSVIPLLEAASVSPGSAHRLPSISTLFHAAVQAGQNRGKPVKHGDLPTLVDAVHMQYPRIASIEDFSPYDPRSEVLVRWDSNVFRMVSGGLERPTAVVHRHALLAEAIDPIVVTKLGYGLSDVGEVILRRVDEVARSLAPYWPEGPLAEVGSAPHVSLAEVRAAENLRPWSELLNSCGDPQRAGTAAARYTIDAKNLECDPSHPTSTFGTAMATRLPGQIVPLPTGNLIDALATVGAELASVAMTTDAKADQTFVRNIWTRAGKLFQGRGHTVIGPVRPPSGRPIHGLVSFDEGRLLALDIVAGLTPEIIQERLDEGGQSLKLMGPDTEVHTTFGSWRIPAHAEVVHVQVIAGPQLAGMWSGVAPTMQLEDLEWILYSAQQSPDDLWYFLKDLQQPRGIGGMFAWDMIDKWEVWKQNKTFYRGGLPLTHMAFAPHAAIAEWKEAATAAPVEQALYKLDLPPLRDWPIVALDHDRGTELGNRVTDQAYRILPWSVPVAILQVDPSGPAELRSMLWDLAVGLAWKLEHSSDAFVDAAKHSELGSLRVTFEFQERGTGPVLTADRFDSGELSIGWDARLPDALVKGSFAVEELCGQLIAVVLDSSRRDAFISAWESAPPGIRVDAVTVPQRVQHLPDPLREHEAVRNDILRQLGEYLANIDVEPMRYEGRDASQLETRTIFPWLLHKLHTVISGLSAASLFEFALVQLESAHHHRFMANQHIGWQRGFPTGGSPDGVARVETLIRTTRAISLLAEEVLAHPPAGDASVSESAWRDALAIAALCIESCFRSDSIHHHLTRSVIEVSDLYEVNIVDSQRPMDVDIAAYQAERARRTMPEAVPIQGEGHAELEPVEEDPKPLVKTNPVLAPIDEVMRSQLGFGVDAAVGILNVATQWEVTAATPAARVPRGAVIAQCVEAAIGATTAEYEAALDWMTLRGDDLAQEPIPHWETERRAKRLTTSPFVADEEHVWVLPWSAGSALQIFANYLSDGRLPWPNRALPKPLVQALDQYRQTQNRRLEQDCVTALQEADFIVRGSVKPEKRRHYGIENLRGEIDALCIDERRSRIWVIEAKDPYTPFSPYQIRRFVNDFIAPKKYVDKLLGKVSDISSNATSIAEALKIPDPSRSWEVVGLMLTRHPEPAAFVAEPQVPFCTIDNLVAVVDHDAAPAPGFHGSTVNAQK